MSSENQCYLGSYRTCWTVSPPHILEAELMDSGQYDQEYLDYLRAVLESMGKAGLVAYVVIWSFLVRCKS